MQKGVRFILGFGILQKQFANENVEETFKQAVKAIDKACAKGIIKKNTASRKKSNLSKKLIAVK